MPVQPQPRPTHGSRALQRAEAFRRSPAGHHQALRFVLNGGVVAVFHFTLGLVLAGPLGFPIQAAIPVAYVAALVLNYVLQRVFVFAHAEFARTVGAQFARFLAVAALQYGLIALLTAVLPGPLGVAEDTVYVATVLLTPVLTFAAMRAFVFHG